MTQRSASRFPSCVLRLSVVLLGLSLLHTTPTFADITDEYDFQKETPDYGILKPEYGIQKPESAKEKKHKEWSLHLGGLGIHAPGYVDDRTYNLMPKKVDSRGIVVIAPALGLSYSVGKWGFSGMYLHGDSFGRKALILGGSYTLKQSNHHHLKLHGAIYSRYTPIFDLPDRTVDYSMRWSYKTSDKKYEIFPIVFLNPGWRIHGPVWFEFATSYILSYAYFSIKF